MDVATGLSGQRGEFYDQDVDLRRAVLSRVSRAGRARRRRLG